jgi:hypothetical protein
MNTEDQEAAKFKIVGQFAVTAERYALLKNDSDQIANALEVGAKNLEKHPENWSFDGDSAPLRDYRDLGKLVDDIKATHDEILRLRGVASSGGFEHLLRHIS